MSFSGEYKIGAQVREYEIVELVRHSGIETIYKARHVLLEEERALKVIRTQLANEPGYRERFVKEAKLFSKLRHKNLVQLFEFGTVDEHTFFMVFELVHGESILERIRKLGKLPISDATRIIQEAAQGLHVAHQLSLHHQNISADCMVLVPSENGGKEYTKVIDFGLAKPTLEETTRYRMEDKVQSRFEYASPESFKRDAEIGVRSDIYSLGITLYYMLSGHLPFQGSSLKEFMEKHLSETPAPLQNVHPMLNRLILKALSKSPDDRQTSMDEFIQEIASIPEIDSTNTSNAPETLVQRGRELQENTLFARRYMIEKKIGQGGMGTVYKALDKILDVPVALKTINRDITDNERTVQRLKREVILARKVAHPNVCRIYDIGETEGQHYVSMEFLEGRSLSELLQTDVRLNVETGVAILKQILQALQEAHRVGIFHRDLKPQNIMVDINGRAFIMDFGISVSQEVRRLTETGMLVGTPRYMAPEQFGDRNVDQRSDIYSIGIIMFEVFTGRLPFDATTPASVMYAHLHGTVLKPSEVLGTIPPDLERIIIKAMERDPQNRYQSISELLADLSNAQLAAASAPTIVKHAPQVLPPTMTQAPPAVMTPDVVEHPTIPAGGSSKSSKPMGWIVGAAILAIAVIAFVLISGRKDDSSKTNETAKSAPTENKPPLAKPVPPKPQEQKNVAPAPAPQNTANAKPSAVDPNQIVTRMIKVASQPPKAEIFLDGQSTGQRTPSSISFSSEEPLTVELRLDGYENARISVDQKSADSINVPLKQLITSGTILYQGALRLKVFEGKKLIMDTSTTQKQSLKAGKYSLLLSDGAMVSFPVKIEVKAGEELVLPVPKVGYFSFRANPSNCKITIDERYQDTPPVIDLPMSPGKHRILVEWPQLELVDEVTVEIKENEKTRMRGFVTDEAVGIVED